MTRTLPILAIAALSLSLSACWGLFPQPGTTQQGGGAAPSADADMVFVEQVADAKAASDAAPGDLNAALTYAQSLLAAYEAGTVERGRLAGDSMVPDALAALDAAATANPDRAADTHVVAAYLLDAAGKPSEATARYEASLAATPNAVALDALVKRWSADRQHTQIDESCATTYAASESGDTRFYILDVCAGARPGMAAADALPWATPEDVAFYEEQLAIETARIQAEREARVAAEVQAAAEEAARRQAEAAALANAPAASGGAAAPQRYEARINVHNDCDDTVKIFRGRVSGKYTGSGTNGSLGSNSSTSYSLSGDDQICLVNDGGDILACSKPADGARLQVTEQCSGFVMR